MNLLLLGDAKALSVTEIERKLHELAPLPKVHYSSAFPNELINDANNRLLYESARLMSSVSISGEWATNVQIKNAVYTCERINKSLPRIPATIGITYSPYHRELDPNVPPYYRGSTYIKELDRFKERFTKIKNLIKCDNEYFKSDVRVGAVLLDMERFHVQLGNDKWNEGMREALDAVHKIATQFFPDAYIHWYGRGIIWTNDDPPWLKSPYFTGNEILTSLSVAFYNIPELEKTLESYRRTVKLADQKGIENVTPSVALACGFRPGLEKKEWQFDWDYDVIYSYLIGRYINNPWYGTKERSERFAQFNRAKVVIFYPPPFDKRVPSWGKHFIAYVRGGTDIKKLDDLK